MSYSSSCQHHLYRMETFWYRLTQVVLENGHYRVLLSLLLMFSYSIITKGLQFFSDTSLSRPEFNSHCHCDAKRCLFPTIHKCAITAYTITARSMTRHSQLLDTFISSTRPLVPFSIICRQPGYIIHQTSVQM